MTEAQPTAEPFECTAVCGTLEAGAGWQPVQMVHWRCINDEPHDLGIDSPHEWARARATEQPLGGPAGRPRFSGLGGPNE